MEHLTKDTFRSKVFDFEKGKEWKFAGERPCIIDFYADWCGPCRMVAPVLEDLAKEYKGKLDVYKVNTDEEQELAGMFGISSIPSILFIPKEGKPQMAMGALPVCQPLPISCPGGATVRPPAPRNGGAPTAPLRRRQYLFY